MEMRLRWYIDESEARIFRRFEELLAEMNWKLDTVMAALAILQRPDALVVNILREKHLEEEEGETSLSRLHYFLKFKIIKYDVDQLK